MSSEQTPSSDTDKTKHYQREGFEAGKISAEGPQVAKATRDSHSDIALEAMVRQRLGYDVRIDKEWTVCQDLEKADPSVPALLVRQDCAWGAVRVDSIPVSNVVTGLGNDFYIVYIDAGQSCRFYQQPSVRFFRRL